MEVNHVCDWETELVIRHYARETTWTFILKESQRNKRQYRKADRFLRNLLAYPEQTPGVEIAREWHGFPHTGFAGAYNPCIHCDTLECTWPEDDGTDTCPVSPKYRNAWHCDVHAYMCQKCGIGFELGEKGENYNPNWIKEHNADSTLFNCPYCGTPGHPYILDNIIEFPPQVKA